MRISDWSSDVCSSDLPGGQNRGPRRILDQQRTRPAAGHVGKRGGATVLAASGGGGGGVGEGHAAQAAVRSEEHTSELQSLMRISYAVFCLKKKKQNTLTYTKIPKRQHYNTTVGNNT